MDFSDFKNKEDEIEINVIDVDFNLAKDLEQIIKEIYAGLQVPEEYLTKD